MKGNKKIEKINKLQASLKYVEAQISNQSTLIRQLERTLKVYKTNKEQLEKQIENLQNEQS